MGANPFICGVVEGFYGRPWSGAQRGQLFAWMQSWGMNTYLYAPKDDLKHRLLWRELYAESDAAELKTLIRHCRGKGLNFVCAVAPGLDLSYSSRKDMARLRRKASQLLRLGCTHFAITFDDIQPVLSKEDSRMFNSLADAQSVVANDFLKHLRDQAPEATLLFCPTHYCERMSGPVRHSDYLKQLGKLLDSSIGIFWTGPEIVSETIPAESIRELQRVLRRKPLLWDNLHANDYDLRRIYLGPYAGRPLELRNEVAGILSNPNCEFEANYIPLRTLAMFAQAKGHWNAQKAFHTALKDWSLQWKAHHGRRISPRELEFLCDCFHLPFRHGRCAETFIEDFRFLLRTPTRKWGVIGRRFEKKCSDILDLFEKIAALRNRELLHALYRHVWELKEEAVLLRKYLHWLKAGPGLKQRLASPDHRPKVYRGGLVADLQRFLPMDENGRFHAPPPAAVRHKPDGPRAL